MYEYEYIYIYMYKKKCIHVNINIHKYIYFSIFAYLMAFTSTITMGKMPPTVAVASKIRCSTGVDCSTKVEAV